MCVFLLCKWNGENYIECIMKKQNHEIINIKSPAIEILICRRDVIDVWHNKNQFSPYWRLYRPYNDCGQIRVNNELIQLHKDEVYLIAPETYFDTMTNGGRLEKFYIHFLVDGVFTNCSNFYYKLPKSNLILELIEIASNRLLNRILDYHLSLNCGAIINAALDLLPGQYLRTFENIDYSLIKVWNLIQDNPTQSYSNMELANIAMMSESTFNHKFSSSFGITPLQFALEQKIRKASILLLNSQLSIAEIAEECGFCDRYYFTRIFTKHRQISPKAFRKKELQENAPPLRLSPKA